MTQAVQPNVYQASQQKSWLYHQLNRPEPVQTIKHTSSNHKIVVATLSTNK